MRTLFAQFGIPEIIVTDYGSCFISAEIEAFFENLKNNRHKEAMRIEGAHILIWQSDCIVVS